MDMTRNLLPFRSGAALVLALSLAACGGGGGTSAAAPGTPGAPSTPQAPATALALLDTTPADGATGVATSVQPQLTFSAALDPASLASGAVRLTHAGGTAPVTVSAAGAQLTLAPTQRLMPLTPYTLEVTGGIAGTGGEMLAATRSVSFTTADASWSAQSVLVADRGIAYTQRIVVDGLGNSTAVWTRRDGTNFDLWASRAAPGGGWDTPQLIENHTGNVADLQLVAAPDGGVMAAWVRFDGATLRLWANRYTPGAGWGEAAQVLMRINNIENIVLGSDAQGNVLALFREFDVELGAHRVWPLRYDTVDGWTGGERLTTGSDTSGVPTLAVNRDGRAVAAWTQFDGIRNSVWVSVFDPATGWVAPRLVDVTNTADSWYPRAAINARGDAIVAWAQWNGTRDEVRASRLTDGTWSAAIPVDGGEAANLEAAFPVDVALDPEGRAFVLWTNWEASSKEAWVVTSAGAGWEPPRLLESVPGGRTQRLAIAAEARGHALATWQQEETGKVMVARYVAGAGWSAPVPVNTEAASAQAPHLSLAPTGAGAIVWQQPLANGGSSVHFSRFE